MNCSQQHLENDHESHLVGGLKRRASETVMAVHGLITSQSLSESFNTRYRRRAAIAFGIYIILGIGYYCGQEKYSVLDSIYYSIITILTIGYGDLVPNSPYQRYFTSFYIILGLLIISAVISSVTEIFHELHHNRINNRVKKAAQRMKNMKENTNYDKVLDFLDVSEKARSSGTSLGRETSTYNTPSSFSSRVRQSMDTFSSAFSSDPSPQEVVVEQRMLAAMQRLNTEMFDEELKDIEHRAKLDFLVVCGVVLFGCVVMLGVEKWYFGEALYWAIVTITTVGYGDVVPRTNSGKVFTIFYAVVGCALLARGLNDLIRYPLLVKAKQNELKVMMQFGGQLSEETLRQILNSDFFERIPNLRQHQHAISKAEFVLMVLGMMNKVNDKDIIIVSKVFEMLDNRKIGSISAEHIVDEIRKAAEREESQKHLDAHSASAAQILAKDKRNPMSNALHVRSLENKSNQLRRPRDGSGNAERLSVNSEHSNEAYNPMMPGQTNQSLKKPLIYEHEPSTSDLSEYGAVRGTYTLSLPEDHRLAATPDSEQERTDLEAGILGEVDDEGTEGAGSNCTDDVY